MQSSQRFPCGGPRTTDLKPYGAAGLLSRGGSWHHLAMVALLLLAPLGGCAKKEVAAPPAPPDVEVAEVIQQDVPIYQEWVAQLNGPVNADITPKVQGYLLKQSYQNGYFVKKGQLLFELDPRQYQAALDQAKAEVAVAEANLARTQQDVARDTPLAAQNAIPQKQLDTDIQEEASWQAQKKAAQAALANAELNLGWTKIHSPIDGIAGAANSQIGDLVGTGTKMATVSQVNPIWVYFSISESSFLSVAHRVASIITGQADLRSATTAPVEYIQANNEPYPAKGKIIYVNRQIGTQTGTIQIAAEFPNPIGILRPGGFGRVRIQTDVDKDALLVPQASVIEVQSQHQLIVVTPDNKAMFRPVKMGERVGTNWIVSEGLKPGEKVVVEGIQKVQMFAAQAPELAKEGIPVTPKTYVPPSAAGGSN